MTTMEPPAAPAPSVSATRSGATPNRRPLLLLVATQLVLAVLLGLIWLAWAPHSLAYRIDLGNGKPVLIPDEGESLVAADGRFVVLTAVAGLVFGLLAWRLRPLRGRLTLLTVTVGSLLASLVTKGIGRLFSGGHTTAPLNTAFRPPLELHANAALFVQALATALVYTIFVGLTGDQGLGRDDRPAGSVAEPEGFRPDRDGVQHAD